MNADNEKMRIRPEEDDSPDFAGMVEAVANGITRSYPTTELIVIKIDNWFDVKWLRFSGKMLGVLSIWKYTLTIPPFVPNRVISQRRFSAPEFVEIESGKPVHINIESSQAGLRRTVDVARGAAVLWYSGNSELSGRGAIMAHVPVEGAYSAWYTGWAKRKTWELILRKEISAQEIAALITARTDAVSK